MNQLCSQLVTRRPAMVLSAFALLGAVPDALPAQESAAPFDAALVAFPADTAIRCMADLDGDGRPEALGIWNYPVAGEVRISGFQSNAQGAFTSLWTFQGSFPGTGGRPDMATGDLDGDGHPDLAVASHSTIRVYLSRGLAQPVEWTMVPANGVTRVVIADFNGDGRNDLAAMVIGFNGEVAQVWTNTGSGLTASGSVRIPGQTGATWFERTELNGDATADLMAAAGGLVSLFRVTNGVPVLQEFIETGLSDLKLCSGDVDNDGDEDIVVFGLGAYRILRRTGPGTFVFEASQRGGPATDLADVDGDGDLDGLSCAGGGAGPYLNNVESRFEVAINRGGGVFGYAFPIDGVASTRFAGAVDVDGDGDKDLISGRAIYYARAPLTAPPYTQILALGFPSNAILDIDRDGDPDAQPGVYGTFRNSGDGNFTLQATVSPSAPAGTRWNGPGFLGDFDGDGAVDLLVSSIQGPEFAPQFVGMRFLRNAGGGGFVDGGPAAGPGINLNASNWQPEWDLPAVTVVGDLDNDGDLDLVVHRIGSGTPAAIAQAWLNDGRGFFTAGFQWSSTSVQAIVDLDGDHIADLVTVEGFYFDSAVVGVRHGLGGGNFGPAVTPGPATLGHSGKLAVVDWDADGDLDLVGGVTAAWTLSILLNQGGLQFVPATGTAPVGRDGARSAVLADVDGDGRRDLLISTWVTAANGTGILLQQPNGLFQAAAEQILRTREFHDLDGDGDADTIIDYGSGFITPWVVRNFTRHGPAAGKRQQYGVASAGSGGMLPVLGASGPFRLGENVDTRLTGAVGGGVGVYVFGTSPADLRDVPVPGMSLYVNPPLVVIAVPLSGAPGQPGAGTALIPYQVPASLVGVTIYKQMFVVDVGMPYFLAASNGLMITYGM